MESRADRPRPRTLFGETARIETAQCGRIYLTLNRRDAGPGSGDSPPCEIFIHLGKAGGCQACLLAGIARLASYAMMHYGMPADEVARMLKGLHCFFPTHDGNEMQPSCLSLIAERLNTETQRHTEGTEK